MARQRLPRYSQEFGRSGREVPEPVRAFPWRVTLSALAVLFLIVVSLAGAGETPQHIPVQLIIAGSLAEAQRILARLKDGGDFAALARQFSIDPTADAGGNLGKVAPDSLPPELRNALDGLEQHIGLGRSATIENIEVWWPASKTRQNFAHVRPNQFLGIREFDATPHPLSRHSFQVGGAAR